MPILISCPQCQGKLRVADELVGHMVRCPACNNVFQSQAEAPAPAAPPAAGPRLTLDLSLEDLNTPSGPAAPRPAPSPSPTPTPAPGAFPDRTERIDPWQVFDKQLEEGPKESDSRQERDTPREPDRREPLPDRQRIEREDSAADRPRRNRFRRTEEDDEEWEGRQRRRGRRDWEPHRAGLVLAMGIISVTVPLACWMCPFVTAIGIITGLVAWVCGHIDLARMNRGEMDTSGRGSTQAGWICGILGTLLSTVVLIGCASIYGWTLYQERNFRNQNQAQPGFQAPPPPVQNEKDGPPNK